MWSELKRHWRELRNGRPGRRFQERYERNKTARAGKSLRFVQPLAGIALLLGGAALLVIPGPGIPVILIGAGLLASRSRPVARAMDWTEVQVRRVIRWAVRWWRQASMLAKNTVLFLIGCGLFGVGYGAWQILFGR